ncbi:MAG: hypothetical protein M3082_11175 [Candidatus Dormibacteraeota bacterium]|nr:hypothetical protein [Candidatus Dormibacteraeota bacterium]
MTWDRTSKAVYVEWQGWTNSTEFSALPEAGLRALKEHQGSRWLADCRKQKAIQQTDPDWVRDWFPRYGSGSEAHGRGHHEKRSGQDERRRYPALACCRVPAGTG